jgi:dihydroorotate dehydrogenase (NAD+) catalytic subunit
VCASFFGCSVKEFAKVAKIISRAKPDFLEANISCPNTESDLGLPFAFSAEDTYKVTKAVKKQTSIPVIVKLASQVTDIVSIGKAAQDGGANAVSAINTVPGMIIDIEAGKPILTNKIGGLSGPAVKPIAVKAIFTLAKALKVPLVGMGGVSYGRDAIEMIMAGATGVGIGSAVYFRGISVYKKVLKEIKEFMKKEKIKNLKNIRGKAL